MKKSTILLLLFCSCSQQISYKYSSVIKTYGEVVAKTPEPQAIFVRNQWTTFLINDIDKWQEFEAGDGVAVAYQNVYMYINGNNASQQGYYLVDVQPFSWQELDIVPNEYQELWKNGPLKVVPKQ